jgi:hypothetical protein
MFAAEFSLYVVPLPYYAELGSVATAYLAVVLLTLVFEGKF